MKRSEKTAGRVRFVTATSLFDGHDAAINIIRRLLQQAGAEVIHLGHNRSAREIVFTAIQEGVHGIAVSSYQGGHVEFFSYMKQLLDESGAGFIRIFGGGGGVIAPDEIAALESAGIEKIYSPEDGQRLGLVGMIDDMIARAAAAEEPPLPDNWRDRIARREAMAVTQLISIAERDYEDKKHVYSTIGKDIRAMVKNVPVIGITGTGGSGKSTLEDEFIRRFLDFYPDKTLAILAIDPTRKKTGGALLGDRIRMNFIDPGRVFMRSLATRESKNELSISISDSIAVLKASNYDLIIVETPGIGQGDTTVTEFCDLSVYVMTSEYGAPSQLEKIDMLDYADLIVINKFDHRNSLDALRDVRKQYRRNRNLFEGPDEAIPVIGTVASDFQDCGLDHFFALLTGFLKNKGLVDWAVPDIASLNTAESHKESLIPPGRANYLWDIKSAIDEYHRRTEESVDCVERLEALERVGRECDADLSAALDAARAKVDADTQRLLAWWDGMREKYSGEELVTTVRGKEIKTRLTDESLSGIKVPLVALPDFTGRADTLRWLKRENLPGYFPYTAGVFPFRRTGEDPKRQFAGEGPPDRTNRRFHFLTKGETAKRLSTAFDSVTLYGEDPSEDPDIFGKIGESGVSICTLDDMKKLYAGFDLCDPSTSVSMTVNGPAPVMLAFFFNTAIDQQRDRFRAEKGREPSAEEDETIKKHVFANVRGTVQADILKEDQGQNSCIFSLPFALRMMGDIQEFFIQNNIRNFYSVSISGYHIAEAGANPVSQLAFTLSNAFTYVEYYLSRGMKIDDFAPNLSFFFSSGMDPEYNVITRVARRIWAVAMRERYRASESSQRLKCHIQTSGRSLHTQDMQFNDIRTTLQALMALNDNCNSLHTNSYDEAVTTPTEESVRRAMAIQLIIAREYGIFKNQNPLQGSFAMSRMTDLMERAVLDEFENLSRRGGVLGAMETHYQRGRIQDESLLYEHKKHTGEYPVIGVNTFIDPAASADIAARKTGELVRSTQQEKQGQIDNLRAFQERNRAEAGPALERLAGVATKGGNVFAELMSAARVASMGQITSVLYRAGGKYRRNM